MLGILMGPVGPMGFPWEWGNRQASFMGMGMA